MGEDLHLVKKGRRVPYQPLCMFANYAVGQAEEHAEPLAQWGWTPARTATLAKTAEALTEAFMAHVGTRQASRAKTHARHAAVLEAKRLIRQARCIAEVVQKSGPSARATLIDLRANQPLDYNPSRISAFMGELIGRLASLDAAMAAHFQGQSVVERLHQARTKLNELSAEQRCELSLLPVDTAAFNRKKGELLTQLEALNAIANAAFVDAPHLKALFRLSRMDRRRRKAKAEPSEP